MTAKKMPFGVSLVVAFFWGGIGLTLAQEKDQEKQESIPFPARIQNLNKKADFSPEVQSLASPVDIIPPTVEDPGNHGSGGFFAEAEYLLLKPRRRNLDFAIFDPVNMGVPQGAIESLEWETQSGVRVGGAYHIPGEGWEVGAYFTYVHSSAQKSLMKPEGGTLFATLTHPGSIDQVDSANASSGLNYKVLDLEIGRAFAISDHLDLRIFGGARLASIDQSLDVLYDGSDAVMATVASPIDFEGAGLRIGGEAHWRFYQGLGFFARASGSLLQGDFRTQLVETNSNGTVTDVNVTDNFRKTVPVADLGMGVSWKWRTLQADVGYEMVNWFGLVDSPDFVDVANQGKLGRRTSDLTLEGLTVQVGLTF